MQEIDNKTETDFVKQCKDRLQKILEKLEWSEEIVKQNFNTNSITSKPTKTPKEVHPPKIPEYPDSCCNQNNLVLDTTKLRELLQDNEVEPPHNFQELQANFSREQKLKIYQHVIENTKKLENNLEIPGAEGELSLAEIVAQKKREEKRKKRKFRKSKPTHIEEVRCLVKLQMKALKQFLNKNNETEMKTINKSRKNSRQREDYREYNDKTYHKRQKHESRAYGKEFRRSSSSPSKELTKTYSKYTAYRRSSRSRSKDLTNTYRRKRSRSKESHYAHKNRDRKQKLYERSCSRELNHKHKRRSRSRSPHYNSYRSRRSRTKSPYGKDSKRSIYYESDPQKRRSLSRESNYTNAYKKEKTSSQRSKSKHSTSCDHNYSSKNRRYPKEEYLNDYKTKESDYYQKSSKHKHTKHKKKHHKKAHS